MILLTPNESEMQDEDQLQNDKEDGLHVAGVFVCGTAGSAVSVLEYHVQFVERHSNFHFQRQLTHNLTMGIGKEFLHSIIFCEAKYDRNGVVPIDLISAER